MSGGTKTAGSRWKMATSLAELITACVGLAKVVVDLVSTIVK